MIYDNKIAVLFGSFFQAGVYLFESYNPSFGAKNFPICSAAIIHPLFCLTSADCVHSHKAPSNVV